MGLSDKANGFLYEVLDFIFVEATVCFDKTKEESAKKRMKEK